jgi:hypothetical protein
MINDLGRCFYLQPIITLSLSSISKPISEKPNHKNHLDFSFRCVIRRFSRKIQRQGVESGPYGVGYPRGKKTAAGRLPTGRAIPQTAVRPFGGWPARRAYKGRAWQARMKLASVRGYPFPYGPGVECMCAFHVLFMS